MRFPSWINSRSAVIATSMALGAFVATWPIAFVTAGTTAPQIAAGPTSGLTLRDVLRQAAIGNPDLLRERVAIDLSKANILAAEGPFDLMLTGDGTFARRLTAPIGGSDLVAGLTQSLTANLALTRALESGGRVSIGAQEIGTRTNARIPCDPGTCTYFSSGLTLTFTHPLLRGFGAEVTLANLRKQRILHDVALLNRQARAAVAIRDVVTAYFELGYAVDDLEIRRSAVALAEEQRKYTQAQVDVGRLGTADLAAVDLAISDRQQAIAVADQTVLIRALDLERLLGRQVPTTFTPSTPPERPSSVSAPIDPTAETARALESSPQLRALRAGLTLSEIDLRTAQTLLRPQLDFVGSVGTTGRHVDFGDAWAQAAHFENINWSAGLTFQLPIQNRAARGAEQAARATGERVHIDVADLELGIRDGVVRITAAARTAARRADLARASIGYAQKNLDAERARFGVGRSTNNDVLLRQQELKNAEIQVARASADLANAETALAALTGDILERYGILLRGS